MHEYSSVKSPRPFGFLGGFVLFVMFVSLCCAENNTGSIFECTLPPEIAHKICEWKTEKPIKMKIEEASISWIAKVVSTLQDVAKSEVYQNVNVTNSRLEILCVLKGGEFPYNVDLTETGTVFSRCFDFRAEVGEIYVINAFRQKGHYCPHDDALVYEDHKDDVASMCHLEFTSPQEGQNACPAKAASCSGDEGRQEGRAPDRVVSAKAETSGTIKLTPRYLSIIFVFAISQYLFNKK